MHDKSDYFDAVTHLANGKHVIFYHQSDLDGIGSAAVALYRLDGFEFEYEKMVVDGNVRYFNDLIDIRGVQYGREPYLDEIGPRDSICVLDYTFGRETMEMLAKDRHMRWVDHHETNILEAAYSAGPRDEWAAGVQSMLDMRAHPNAYAAIELTWLLLFPGEPMPPAVTLLGAYDTYRFRGRGVDLEHVLSFQHGMRRLGLSPVSWAWKKLFQPVGRPMTSRQRALVPDIDILRAPAHKKIPNHPGHRDWPPLTLRLLTEGDLIRSAKEQDNLRMARGARDVVIESPLDGKIYRALAMNGAGSSNVLSSRWNPDMYDFVCFYFATSDRWLIKLFAGDGCSKIHLGDLAKALAIKHGFLRHDGKPSGGGGQSAAGIDVEKFQDVQKIIPVR